jgi:hypothetical protein
MTPLHRLAAAAAMIGLVLSAEGPSRASVPDAPPVQQAAEHFQRGVQLYEEQDWRAALIEFDRAYSLIPRFQALFNVAQCRYQLEDYAGALGAFEKYLADGADSVPKDERDRVQSTIDDLRARIARVRVETDVGGAEITVDDAVVGTTPLSAAVLVSEGRRKIAASKSGYEPASRFVDVAGRDSIEVRLALHPIPAPVATRVDLVKPAKSGKTIAPAIAAFGLGAAGIGVGAAFGLAAIGNKSSLDLVCSNRACPPSAQGQIDALRRNAVVSTAGFSAGALGVAGGIAWLLFASGRRESAPPPDSGLYPVLGPGLVGAGGSF